MSGNIHYLHPRPPQISQFLRVGSTGHRKLEHLLGGGKLPPTRFVIDAASYDKQIDLIRALKEVGAEIVLDTNAAELSTIGRYRGTVSGARGQEGRQDKYGRQRHDENFRKGVRSPG